jgi:hypothetical protein
VAFLRAAIRDDIALLRKGPCIFCARFALALDAQ